MELHETWKWQMRNKNAHSRERQVLSPLWQLRANMAFLVDNLQYYLYADVLDTQFARLAEQVAATRDFDATRKAHDEYLTALLTDTFRAMRPVGGEERNGGETCADPVHAQSRSRPRSQRFWRSAWRFVSLRGGRRQRPVRSLTPLRR